MDRIKVLLRIKKSAGKEKIECMCKQSSDRYRCCTKGKECEEDEVLYDKYKNIKECFKNQGSKNYKL